MLAAQGVMFAASVGLSIFAAMGWLTPWQLLAFTFAVGAGGAFMMPAWSTAVSDIVTPGRVPAAIALNALSFQVARSVGPAIGGAVIAIGGATLAFVLNSLSYLGFFVVLLGWKRPPETRAARPQSLGPAIASGLRYAGRSAMMRSALTRVLLFGFCASPLQTFLVILAGDSQSSSFILGALLGAFGLGAIVGALATARLRASATQTQVSTAAGLVTASASIVVAIDALAPLRMAALFFAGASWVAVLSSLGIIVQMSSPRWVVGRALSLQLMALNGGMALGAALWGKLAAVAGLPVAFFGAAAAILASIGLARRLPLPDGVDLKPAAESELDPGSDPP